MSKIFSVFFFFYFLLEILFRNVIKDKQLRNCVICFYVFIFQQMIFDVFTSMETQDIIWRVSGTLKGLLLSLS